MSNFDLKTVSYNCLLDLATEEGFNASGKDEIFGCVFGRDSAITILKILKAVSKKPDSEIVDSQKLLYLCQRAIDTLISLQGTEINFESGEEPGKFIHEYRKDRYENLINNSRPWFIYPDGKLRNYDSLDSTPLALIAIYNFWQISRDDNFLSTVLTSVEKGINWIINFGDRDNDLLQEYEFSKTRRYGGLEVQSWTDSFESLKTVRGVMPSYPIAPVEVQGYAWLALKLWANYFRSDKLNKYANGMKRVFNEKFIFSDNGYYFPAQALDGEKQQIKTITGNPMLLLWASLKNGDKPESILYEKYIPDLVRRTFEPDLFDIDGGIRTMSAKSQTFNPGQDSYHNGSFWPKLNGLACEGLENFGFSEEARLVKVATVKALSYFQTPIELYTKGPDGSYREFKSKSGQVSCKNQAWSAAVALDMLT